VQPRRPLAAAALTGAVALSGCMGDGSGGQRPPESGARIGQPVRLVDCVDWRDANVRERYGTVRELREFAGGRSGSPGGRGATLDDRRAYELFERYCAKDFASHFKLYKLYTRAAAFSRQ
jgi:hypothetical protein